MSKSVRYLELVQQIEYLPYPLEELEKKLISYGIVKEYAYIIHDKDVKDDGTLKAPHIHCILGFKTPTTIQAVSNYLGIEQEWFSYLHDTPKSAKLYLVHAKDDSKAKYEPSAVKSTFNYVQWYERQKRTGALNTSSLKEQAQEVLEKLAIGEFKEYDLYDESKVSGILYVTYKRKFLDMIEWTYRTKQNKEKDMNVIFVTGKAGVGKSTYAREFAIASGMHYYISSGGKNALDDYHGEECIILDDWRDSNMSVADMCKLLDNYVNSMVSCRYYNKSISNCECLIITSVVDIKDFYDGLKDKGELEPLEQLCRRINVRVRVTQDYYYYSLYKEKEWVEIKKSPTPKRVRELLCHEMEEKLNSIASVMGIVEPVECKPVQEDIYKGAYKTDPVFKKKVDRIIQSVNDDEETPF